MVTASSDPDVCLAIHEAIEQLSREDWRLAQMAEMRVFGEMSNQQIAVVLGVSLSTVEKDWRYVRTRLKALLD
jgi:DNA-directed RNA polymerase specialized sigma24 family protein